MSNQLSEYLKTFLKEDRIARLETVLGRRTDYLTVVLEDIHYSQNASSIIRHCDAFGIQNISVIENRNKFKIKNHAVRGTLKWIHLERFNERCNNSLTAIHNLQSKGYRIIATCPGENGSSLSSFDLYKGKAALFFGNERDGLSKTVLDNADERLYIPMEGFVESLNISASCAIILQNLSERLRNSDLNWQLGNKEKEELLLSWLKNSIKKIDSLMDAYRSTLQP